MPKLVLSNLNNFKVKLLWLPNSKITSIICLCVRVHNAHARALAIGTKALNLGEI